MSKLKNILVGGRGSMPSLASTLATGGIGAGTNVAYGLATDNQPDRSLLSKALRIGTDAATGAGMAITGHDRFGLAGAAAGTGLGLGSRKLQDTAADWAENKFDSPYARAGVETATNASIGSMAGTMMSTSFLRGGGLRSLGLKLLDKMTKGTTNPILAPINEAIERQGKYEHILNELGLKGISVPEFTAAVQKLRSSGYSPKVLEKLKAEFGDNLPEDSNALYSALYSRNSKLKEDMDVFNDLYYKDRHNQRFDQLSDADKALTTRDLEIHEILNRHKLIPHHSRGIEQADEIGEAFDTLLGKPATTSMGIAGAMQDALAGRNSATMQESSLRQLADSEYGKLQKAKEMQGMLSAGNEAHKSLLDKLKAELASMPDQNAANAILARASKPLTEDNISSYGGLRHYNSPFYSAQNAVSYSNPAHDSLVAKLEALAEEHAAAVSKPNDYNVSFSHSMPKDLQREEALKLLDPSHPKADIISKLLKATGPADRISAFAPQKGFMNIIRALGDNYAGSPNTADLLRKYKTLQNIPAGEYLKAQIMEDILQGSAAGLAFAPITAGPAFYDAYKKDNEPYLNKLQRGLGWR